MGKTFVAFIRRTWSLAPRWHRGRRGFKSRLDGEYTFHVLHSDINNKNYIGYEYTISSLILGLDPMVFIDLITAIAVTLALLIALTNVLQKKKV
jgi:hypothetical protein